MDREEVYHRLQAKDVKPRGCVETERFEAAVEELWPYALGVRSSPSGTRCARRARAGREEVDAVERGEHSDELRELWNEMTMVRRSIPGATW